MYARLANPYLRPFALAQHRVVSVSFLPAVRSRVSCLRCRCLVEGQSETHYLAPSSLLIYNRYEGGGKCCLPPLHSYISVNVRLRRECLVSEFFQSPYVGLSHVDIFGIVEAHAVSPISVVDVKLLTDYRQCVVYPDLVGGQVAKRLGIGNKAQCREQHCYGLSYCHLPTYS